VTKVRDIIIIIIVYSLQGEELQTVAALIVIKQCSDGQPRTRYIMDKQNFKTGTKYIV